MIFNCDLYSFETLECCDNLSFMFLKKVLKLYFFLQFDFDFFKFQV